MSKFYWGFIGVVVALFIYAGATGNFGIIPKLPVDLPFGGQLQPTANVLIAPIIYPQMTGSTGFTADQFVKRVQQHGGKVQWERSTDERSWIMRYAMQNELTGNDFAGAVRFTYLPDAGQAGVTGPGFLVSGWAEDGQDMTGFQITNMLAQIAAGMYQDGQLQ